MPLKRLIVFMLLLTISSLVFLLAEETNPPQRNHPEDHALDVGFHRNIELTDDILDQFEARYAKYELGNRMEIDSDLFCFHFNESLVPSLQYLSELIEQDPIVLFAGYFCCLRSEL